MLLLFIVDIFYGNTRRLLLLNRIRVHLIQLTIDVDSEILSLLEEQVFDVGSSGLSVLLYLLCFFHFRLVVVFEAEIAN